MTLGDEQPGIKLVHRTLIISQHNLDAMFNCSSGWFDGVEHHLDQRLDVFYADFVLLEKLLVSLANSNYCVSHVYRLEVIVVDVVIYSVGCFRCGYHSVVIVFSWKNVAKMIQCV